MFSNQPIIPRGQTFTHIYKLTQGTVQLLDHHNKPFTTLKAPQYLNLIETIFSCPLLKTVKKIGKCHIIKVKLKDHHKHILRSSKEQGIRKCKFSIFDKIPLPHFYQLTKYGHLLQPRKHEQIKLKDNYLYLIVKGRLTVSGREPILKLIEMEEGQSISPLNSVTFIEPLTENLKLFQIDLQIVSGLLGEEYHSIAEQIQNQNRSLQSFKNRNQRLSRQLSKNRKQSLIKIPTQFANKFELQSRGVDQYCRAKSCLGTHKSNKDIQIENAARFRQAIQLNQRIYRNERASKRQLKSSCKIPSFSCTSVPPNQESCLSLTEIVQNIYRSFSQKDKQAGLECKIVINRWESTKKPQHRLKKVRGSVKKENIFNKTMPTRDNIHIS